MRRVVLTWVEDRLFLTALTSNRRFLPAVKTVILEQYTYT